MKNPSERPADEVKLATEATPEGTTSAQTGDARAEQLTPKQKARRFGSMLKWMRRDWSMSRRELADRAGLRRKVVARIERGEFLPSPDTRRKLEGVFGCKLRVGD